MVGFISPYSKYKNRHRKSIFTERIKVQFEDGEFWAPKGYDEYLRNIYGDYMQLPPKEQQKTHHANNVYWK
jgi:lipopolysaccharide cholinephosphotransferase